MDLEALSLKEADHLVAIASRGCNIVSYLAAAPIRFTAIDLNLAHVALNKLKLAAIQHLLDYRALHRFLAEADAGENVRAYEDYIQLHLDETSRRYWEGRNLFGRRRIGYFRTNLYRHGLLGTFIGASHLKARMHGRNPRKILAAKSLGEQRKIFESELAPLFEGRHIRWRLNRLGLIGLGIPRSQFEALKRPRPRCRTWCISGWSDCTFRSLGQLLRMASLRPALCDWKGRPCCLICFARISTICVLGSVTSMCSTAR